MATTSDTSVRRRTSRVGRQLTGRWVRTSSTVTIEVSDLNMHGLFMSTPLDMPLGQLQQIEVDLPMATVQLLVIPRHATRTEWMNGLGLEIFAVSPLDRNLWMACFQGMRDRSPRRERLLRAV